MKHLKKIQVGNEAILLKDKLKGYNISIENFDNIEINYIRSRDIKNNLNIVVDVNSALLFFRNCLRVTVFFYPEKST